MINWHNFLFKGYQYQRTRFDVCWDGIIDNEQTKSSYISSVSCDLQMNKNHIMTNWYLSSKVFSRYLVDKIFAWPEEFDSCWINNGYLFLMRANILNLMSVRQSVFNILIRLNLQLSRAVRNLKFVLVTLIYFLRETNLIARHIRVLWLDNLLYTIHMPTTVNQYATPFCKWRA